MLFWTVLHCSEVKVSFSAYNLFLCLTSCARNVHSSNTTNKKVGTSSHNWLERRKKDVYTKQATRDHYRCRSAYKLKEIDEKHGILQFGDRVVDCGAAPGSWSQLAMQRVNALGQVPTQPTGLVIGVDLQHISPLDGATFLGGHDFTSPDTQAKILKMLKPNKADIIISDMAPKATGNKDHNHNIIIQLCFSVLRFSLVVLRPGGTVVCKIWQGSDHPKLTNAMLTVFEQVKAVKPQSSYDNSIELFLVGKGFKYSPKQ